MTGKYDNQQKPEAACTKEEVIQFLINDQQEFRGLFIKKMDDLNRSITQLSVQKKQIEAIQVEQRQLRIDFKESSQLLHERISDYKEKREDNTRDFVKGILLLSIGALLKLLFDQFGSLL